MKRTDLPHPARSRGSSGHPRDASPVATFDKILRAFDTGGFTYTDFLEQLNQLLATGAPAAELLEVLRRRELIEPLPRTAHNEVQALLTEAIKRAEAAGSAEPEQTSSDFEADELPEWAGASDEDDLVERLRSAEEQIALHQADYEALAESYERARAVESATIEREISLVNELAAARAALDSAQGKSGELTQSLTRRLEDATRESNQHREQLRFVQNALAARDAQLLQLQQSEDESQSLRARFDAQAADLASARASLEDATRASNQQREQLRSLQDALAARDAQLSQLQRSEDESQSLRARFDAQAADLASARASLENATRESNQRRDQWQSLQEALAARDGELQAARTQASSLITDLAAARSALESERQKTEEAGEEAANSLSSYQTELRALQQALAARDSTLAELEQSVAARDAELASARTKTRDLEQAVTESNASTDVAITRGEDALNELNHHRDEAQKLRDELAASVTAIAGVRRSLSEREGELAALRRIAEGGAQLEEDIRKSRSRVESIAAELAASEAAAAPLVAQRDRLQGQVASLQAKIKTYEELLEQSHRAAEQREAERGEEFVAPPVLASVPAPQRPNLIAAPEQPRSPAPPPTKPKARPAAPGGGRSQFGRPIAIGAVILALIGLAWYVTHRSKPLPPVAPAVVSVAPAAGMLIRDCPTCPAMTVLPAGRFIQGSDRTDAPSFEKPLHWVIIASPLAMSTNPVTVGEFQQFIEATNWDMQGCDTYDGEWKRHPENGWKNPGFAQTPEHPVTCASWEDAQAFAEWLSTKTGHKYRLPSASEWEYAARAGGDVVQPWNPDGSDACANANVADANAAQRYPGWTVFGCDDGYVNTAPVGTFKANAFGLHDMLGNVFQWTEDCWHKDYVDAPVDGSARDDGGCVERELRGGSWFTTPAYVRANYRNHFASDYRTSSVGIRLVRGVEP